VSTAFFNPDLHPRAGDGTFTEVHHAEAGFTLDGPAGPQLDLEYIAGIAADIQIAAGPHRVDKGMDPDEEEAAWQAYKAANTRLKEFGGADKAAIAVGEMIAARGEAIAGISVNEIRSAAFVRLDGAREAHEAATAAWQARPDGTWDQELYMTMERARATFSNVKDGRDPETKADMRRLADGYLEALREVRPMGGDLELHPDSHKKAVALFKDAAQFYPTDWVQTSNEYNPLLANYGKKRGHYRDTHYHSVTAQAPVTQVTTHAPGQPAPDTVISPEYNWEATGNTRFGSYRNHDTDKYEYGELPEYRSVAREVIRPGQDFRQKKDGSPYGTGWEKWVHPVDGGVYWRRPRMKKQAVAQQKTSQIQLGLRKEHYMDGRDPDMSTATHELGHRMQYSVGNLNDLERAFLVRRTSVQSGDFPEHTVRQALEPVYGTSRKELCRPDHFANRYMGKEYDKVTEIVTMGMESLFTGTNGGLIGVGRSDPDREFRDFILGAVATAGGRNEHKEPIPAFLQ
jgi:hypothetical protein